MLPTPTVVDAMDFHSYVARVTATRPSGTAWCHDALHAVLSLCSAATWLEDTAREGRPEDGLTQAAISVALESFEAARALAFELHGLHPRRLAPLALRGPSLRRATAEQASLARALVAVTSGRPGPSPRRDGRPASLLRALDRRRAYVYRIVGLSPEDVWQWQGWRRPDDLQGRPPKRHDAGRIAFSRAR